MPNSRKPNICLIYTGGTIGMECGADGILRPPANPRSFLNIVPELEKMFDITTIFLMNKDSTNMVPADWADIAATIYNNRNLGFDGFVVAHGTDTMHFTATAAAFALGKNLNFPVVFTGSQTAPHIPHGDARLNLLRAFKVASTDIAEVVICFGDYVFRGCRAQKKDERRFDAFESPAIPPLAHITEEIILSNFAIKKEDKKGEIVFQPRFASGILQISLTPGLEPELLTDVLYNDKCKGIILQAFGAGNVPNEGCYSWINFVEKSRELGKPVLITSQFPANSTLNTAYAPGRDIINAGAIPTGNMTSACAAVKFRWVLAQVEKIEDKEKQLEKVAEMMNEDFVGELDRM